MKWTVVALALLVSSLIKREPERTALRGMARELAALDASYPAATASR